MFSLIVLFTSSVLSACSSPAFSPTETVDQNVTPIVNATETISAAPTETEKPTATATPEQLQLEILQSHAWVDSDGNTRTDVLVRNPYDFPVEPDLFAGLDFFSSSGDFSVNLLNSSGEVAATSGLLFWGDWFIPPHEMAAAYACFEPCSDGVPLPEWETHEFQIQIFDASDRYEYTTDIKANVNISLSGGSPIFWIDGSVTNNSGTALDRISVRVFLFDQEGNYVGSGEGSAWDVGSGATANLEGAYGIWEVTGGPIDYQVAVLGIVNYWE